MTFPALVYHAAGRSNRFPPNTLRGLSDCLVAGARFIEVDINPLADGGYALLHERFLEDETDGKGSVVAATGETVRTLRRRWQGTLTDERVALLSDAAALAAGAQTLVELQLDLKAYTPVPDVALASLGRTVGPLGRRVRVSSTSDRDLRRLHELRPTWPWASILCGTWTWIRDPVRSLRATCAGSAHTAIWMTTPWRPTAGGLLLSIWLRAQTYSGRRRRFRCGTSGPRSWRACWRTASTGSPICTVAARR